MGNRLTLCPVELEKETFVKTAIQKQKLDRFCLLSLTKSNPILFLNRCLNKISLSSPNSRMRHQYDYTIVGDPMLSSVT